MPAKILNPGDPVRLIRDPEAKGHVTIIHNRGLLRLVCVTFTDGTTELCTSDELELN